MIILARKNMLYFVDNTSLKDDVEQELGNFWERCNAIVISWIMYNISKELHSSILLLRMLTLFGLI